MVSLPPCNTHLGQLGCHCNASNMAVAQGGDCHVESSHHGRGSAAGPAVRHPPACGVQRARATMHTLCKGRQVNSVSVAISWPVMALGMLATYHAKRSLRGGAQGPRAAPRQHPAGVLQASAAHMLCHACIDSSTALAQCIAPMAQVAGGQCSCRWHVSCVRLRHLTTGRLEGFRDAPPWCW